MEGSAVARSAPRGRVHWEYVLPIFTVHLLACFAFVPWCFSWSGVVLALAGTIVFGTLGINLCYHRLLAHRSLKLPRWLERTFTTIAVCSLEDTPARWVANHRLHHVHSDDELDPHSPRDGIGWSHAGWLFRPAPQRRTYAFFEKYARDILADDYYRWLERNPVATVIIYGLHAAAFALAGLLVGRVAGGGWSHGLRLAASWLVWGVYVRTVLVWHITWSVNSLTHLFGYRSYETGEDSRNNWLVGLLAMGEGWHNNHHHDPASASVQHRWWEFDPTYWIILALERLGLATDVIRPRHQRASRSAAVSAGLGLVFVAAVTGSAVAEPRRPNILFIFTDDHAQHAISAYGSVVNHTPHLDRLAAGGARFANSFVTNSICTPSRATLLTGQYSHKNGVPVFNRFDGSRDTAAKRLQAAGYHTGMIGKWHLGSDPTGFDRWIVLPGQGAYWNPVFLVPEGRLTVEGHTTDIIGDLGVEFLDTRPQDRPFFLMLHHKAPHRSWEPDERNLAKFKDAVIPEPETLWDDYATRPAALPENRQTIAGDLTRRDLKLVPPPDLVGTAAREWLGVKPEEVVVNGRTITGRELVAWKYQRYMQDYLACVQGVDDNVGKVLDHLGRLGLADDTVVIYTTDNGWYLGDLGLYDKRFMYEPGLRVPLLVRGPGIPVGLVPEAFVANIDLAPTFLDLAGLPVPASMQGRSIVPLLRGETPADWRTSVYYRYYHDPGHHDTRAHYGVRTATHKLIHYWTKDAWELFDLAHDPQEQHNLLFDPVEAARPEVATLSAELKAEIGRLQREFDDDGLYADPATWPAGGVDGAGQDRPALGPKTVAEALALAEAAAVSVQ